MPDREIGDSSSNLRVYFALWGDHRYFQRNTQSALGDGFSDYGNHSAAAGHLHPAELNRVNPV